MGLPARVHWGAVTTAVVTAADCVLATWLLTLDVPILLILMPFLVIFAAGILVPLHFVKRAHARAQQLLPLHPYRQHRDNPLDD